MNIILYILGALFLLSKRRGRSDISLARTVTASPFGTTPAGGSAGIIAPVGDPYAGITEGSGGGAAIATNAANIGSTFGGSWTRKTVPQRFL